MTTPKNRQAALSAFNAWMLTVIASDKDLYLARHAETIREALQDQSTDALREALEKISKEYSHGQVGKIAQKALEPAGK